MPAEQNSSSLRIVANALNRIRRYDLDRDLAASRRCPPNGQLFHYTTADGLKGIVEQRELRASSAYFLNDSAEILYGYCVLNEVLRDWISKRNLTETSVALGTAHTLERGFGHDLQNRNMIQPIYLACFCEDDNLLSQWRNYGQSGGYSLGFNSPCEGTVHGLMPEACAYTARWVKVEYERDEQARRCRTVLDYLLPILDEPNLIESVREIDPLSPFGYQGLLTAISDILLEEIVAFKSRDFEVEKEWRIVVRQRELLKQGTDDGGATPLPIHFRAVRGLLVPYVKLIPIEKGNLLPLVSVRSGPTRDTTTSWIAVRMLLDKHNYTKARADKSEITVIF